MPNCSQLTKLLLHLLFASRYGYFADELYYIACSGHLDWGYVDHPPLIALLMWLALPSLGSSLLSLRVLPALAGVALVTLAGMLARKLGARRFGTNLAAFLTACVGISFVLHYLMTMNAFEPLLWNSCSRPYFGWETDPPDFTVQKCQPITTVPLTVPEQILE